MSFYVTGGTLQSDAPSYVEREADRQLYDGLLHGEFCYVLTARQMGKSSLMVRTGDRLQTAGIHVAALDLTALGAQNITAEQWYYGLLDTLGLALGLQTELEKYWQDHRDIGPLHCFMKSIQELILPRLQRSRQTQGSPAAGTAPTTSVHEQGTRQQDAAVLEKSTASKVRLVIFVDEIDFVRSLPFSTDEFFAAIRECYNHRTIDPSYETLTFCLLGVASPSDLIRDTRTTPFNIGRRVELNDFTPEEAAPLSRGLRESGVEGRTAKRLLDRVLHWTNGHPYLTQRLCLATVERLRANKASGLPATHSSPGLADQLCNDLFFRPQARELDDNLIFVRERLLRSEVDLGGLLDLYRSVWRGKRVMDDPRDPLIRLLTLSGIVRVTDGRLVERNRIYGRVFDGEWARSNLPKAELRRQREAYFRGVIRTTLVTIGVFLVMAVLIAMQVRARQEAREALWKSLYRQAQLNRASTLAGKRFEALDSIRQASKIRMASELTDEAIACLATIDFRPKLSSNVPDKGATALRFTDDLQDYALGSPSGQILLRRVSDNGEIGRWSTGGGSPERIWISRDKQYLAAARGVEDSTLIWFWRYSSGERLFSLTNRMQLEAFDFRPDGKQVALAGEDGLVRIISLPGGEEYTKFTAGESCSVVRYDPEGRRLAIGHSGSLKLEIYDAVGGTPVNALHSASPVREIAWHPSGQIVAGACEDRQIRLWATDGEEFAMEELPRQAADITALVFSRSGDMLTCACADQTVRLWYGSHNQAPLSTAGGGNVGQLQFDENDRLLGLAGSGGMLRVMEVAPGEGCHTLSEFDAKELNSLSIHPNGRLLATAHSGGITFWDLATGRKLGRMPAGSTAAARFHPSQGEIIDAEFRGTYCFDVDEETHADRHTFSLRPREDFYLGPGALAVDFAANADVIAVAYGDRVRLARSTNSAYAAMEELIGDPGFKTVAVSPDGRQVAAGNWARPSVWVWNRASGAKPFQLPVSGRAYVCFSPDGSRLAVGTERSVTLWETHSWTQVQTFERPFGTTRPASIAFAKNRSLWAVAWGDATIRLLDMGGKTIANLEPPEKEQFVDLAFTLDGSRLACATSARTVVVWDIDELVRRLGELGLSINLKTSAVLRGNVPQLGFEIGALDRLRFSQPKYLIGKRREIAELTNFIKAKPGAWHLYYYRARLYRELGEFESAIGDYQRWIDLDRAAGESRSRSDKAWPLRDLALIYLFGPPSLQDFEKALNLTKEALSLDLENPDNHFRHGVACYRLGDYDSATNHLETARHTWEKQKKEKDVAEVLVYEAMCLAHKMDSPVASSLLEQAKQMYARSDLEYARSNLESRNSLLNQLPDLLWEAERVVTTPGGGG
jgi:WD40 repeat protein